MTTSLAAAVTALVLTSCGTTEETTDASPAVTEEMTSEEMDDESSEDMDDDMDSEEEMTSEDMDDDMESSEDDDATGADDMMSGYVDYADYAADPGAYDADEGAVVLFFHADWCPSCRATEESLTTEGVPDGLTVVKVDYDEMTDLRQEYGVTQQHTFVQIDGEGEEITTWTGSGSGEEILDKTEG